MDLNTSYVKVQQPRLMENGQMEKNLNTSYVKVQHYREEDRKHE